MAERGTVNSSLRRAYERLGWWYIPGLVAFLGLSVLVQAPIALWLEVRYLEATSQQFWELTALIVPVLLAAMTVGLLVSWDALATPLRWLRAGRPPELAGEVWRRSVNAGYLIVNRSAIAIAIAIAESRPGASHRLVILGGRRASRNAKSSPTIAAGPQIGCHRNRRDQ